MYRRCLSFGLSVYISFLLISCQRNPVPSNTEISSTPSGALTGRILYGTESGLWMMNTDGSNRAQITHPDPADTDYYPSWSPDGTQISFRRDPKDGGTGDPASHGAMIMNVDGNKLVNLTKNYGAEATAGTPRWSPDSSKLAITCHCPDGEGIYIINSDGTELKKLIGGMVQYPDWSPDGKKIAYIT